MRATVGLRPLEPVGDLALGGPRQPLVGERRPGPVTAQPLDRRPIVLRDHDPGVQRVALEPRAPTLDATLGQGRVGAEVDSL